MFSCSILRYHHPTSYDFLLFSYSVLLRTPYFHLSTVILKSQYLISWTVIHRHHHHNLICSIVLLQHHHPQLLCCSSVHYAVLLIHYHHTCSTVFLRVHYPLHSIFLLKRPTFTSFTILFRSKDSTNLTQKQLFHVFYYSTIIQPVLLFYSNTINHNLSLNISA